MHTGKAFYFVTRPRVYAVTFKALLRGRSPAKDRGGSPGLCISKPCFYRVTNRKLLSQLGQPLIKFRN